MDWGEQSLESLRFQIETSNSLFCKKSMVIKTKKIALVERRIDHLILIVREQRVILDRDLALIYGVATKSLNLAVKRNRERFPAEFMFRLKRKEFEQLRFQIETSKRGGTRYLPYAFTEYGAVMIANVLNSDRAIKASIQVVKAFVQIREILATHREFAEKLQQLEMKYDKQFKIVFDAIRELMDPPIPRRKPIGFRIKSDNKE